MLQGNVKYHEGGNDVKLTASSRVPFRLVQYDAKLAFNPSGYFMYYSTIHRLLEHSQRDSNSGNEEYPHCGVITLDQLLVFLTAGAMSGVGQGWSCVTMLGPQTAVGVGTG